MGRSEKTIASPCASFTGRLVPRGPIRALKTFHRELHQPCLDMATLHWDTIRARLL